MSDHRINHEPAFLLASVPWRESSLRLEVFSRSYGRVALLARSARKRQSELRGILVPFVPIDASWYGNTELKSLHRAEWLGGWPQPQGRALFSGLYINELILKLTAREDPIPELYDALEAVMRAVCGENSHTAALRRFEWTLLNRLGFAPDLFHDGNGEEIRAEETYWLTPENAVMPIGKAERFNPRNHGVAVGGDILIQLREGDFTHPKSLGQSLKITRLLIDNLLPEGIKSRQVLQQLQQFSLGV